MKCQSLDFANPDRFLHLLGQFFERVPVTTNYAVGNFHLCCELFVVGADLDVSCYLADLNRIALFHVHSGKSLLGKDDPSGVSNCNDFGNYGHGFRLLCLL